MHVLTHQAVFKTLATLAVTTLGVGTIGCATVPCPSPAAMTSIGAAQKASIADLLDNWHAAAARADESAYFQALADDAFFLGTDATERWDKVAFRAYAHPHFAKGKAWTFSAKSRHIILSTDGKLGWFDEALETANMGPARGSGVVRRDRDGVWRIVQYNLTLTIPNRHVDAVRDLIRP